MKLQNKSVWGILTLSAAVFITACSSDELTGLTNNDSTEAISLDTYVARNIDTRAVVQTDALLKSNGFCVFAYYDGGKSYANTSSSVLSATPNLMDGQTVSYSSSEEKWSYSPVRYWSKTATDYYQFIAYAPLSASSNITKTAAPVLAYDATTSNYDFMTAVNKDQQKPESKIVPLTFKHRLSRLGFIAKTKSDYTGTSSNGATIKITSAKLTGAYLKGSYSLTSELATANSGWSNTSTADYTILSSTANAITLSTENTNLIASNEYLFVVPSTSSDFTLDITYEIVQGKATYKESAKLEAKSKTLEMGKAYNFIVTIALDQIDFTLQSVEGWGNGSDFTAEY